MRAALPESVDAGAAAAEVVAEAMDDLGARCGLWGLDSEPGLQLFLLGCLAAELHSTVLDTVWDCRSRDFTWEEIGELLGLDAELARARYDDSDAVVETSSQWR